MRIALHDLRTRTAECPGIRSELLRVGQIAGDGASVVIDDASFEQAANECAELKRVRGLGDLVHVMLSPVVEFSDGHLGTDLANCAGCGERQAGLNEAVPFGKKAES